MMTERNELILANLIANRAETDPDRDVLTFENGDGPDEVRTYKQLWECGSKVAQALVDEGMAKGDYFAILMQNHPEFIDVMVGASITGAVFVPIDPRTKGQKLHYLLMHSGCKGIVCADYSLDAVMEVSGDLPNLQWIWVLGQSGALQRVISKNRVRFFDEIYRQPVPSIEIASTDPLDPMEIMYTSGTTGDPKGVVIRHVRWGSVANWNGLLGYLPDDRPYTGLSLTHGNAQLLTLSCVLKLGMRAVFSRKFTKSRLWDIARKYGCTTFNLLGGMTTAIYSEPPKPNDNDNPIRLVISAGMPAAIWESFEKRFNLNILEIYAAVEGGLTIKPVGQGPIGSIGKAPPSLKLRLVDEYGEDVPVGSQGEIIFQPADDVLPQVDYLHDPEASKKKVHGGWLRMGDIGHLDAEGWLFFDFRAGGAIRHNGDFIQPASIEKVLAESPLVTDVYVYGVKAASGAPGEKDVVAAIVPANADDLHIPSLFAHCRAALEASSIPTYFQVVTEIPKTASEKPIERFLLEAFNRGDDQIFKEDGSRLCRGDRVTN